MACFVGAVAITPIHFQAEDVTPKKLTTMAVDIVRGLAYLNEMKFVHRYVQCFTFPPQPGMKIVWLTCLLHEHTQL